MYLNYNKSNDTSSYFEEGPSKMIELEDVENSYHQLMLEESDKEEISGKPNEGCCSARPNTVKTS